VTPAPFAHAAEFGAKNHPVFGRKLPQGSFVRRVWPEHSGDGHVVGPALEDNTDKIVEMYADAMDRELRKAFPG